MKTSRSNTAGRKPSTPGKPQGGQVQSLTRGLTLLERMSKTDHGLLLTDLAGSLGLAPSTTHRLLNSMAQDGFVECDEATGLWSVGVKTFTVGNAYLKKRDFVAEARPFMSELVLSTGETSNLALLQHDHIVFVAQVESKEVMRMVVQIGSHGPIHAAGVGKALLSSLSNDHVTQMVQRTGLPPLTERTITTPGNLLAELELIRKRGYALDDEEQKVGLRCIAANIYDATGEAVAALSISGPTARMTEDKLPDFSAKVMAAAASITEMIGGAERP